MWNIKMMICSHAEFDSKIIGLKQEKKNIMHSSLIAEK